MATDYDAPRKTEDEAGEESIEELKARRHDKNSGKVDEDEVEAAESFELPGADLSHEELAVEVRPRQDDEFTCMSCLLMRHRSQLADADAMICSDCARPPPSRRCCAAVPAESALVHTSDAGTHGLPAGGTRTDAPTRRPGVCTPADSAACRVHTRRLGGLACADAPTPRPGAQGARVLAALSSRSRAPGMRLM